MPLCRCIKKGELHRFDLALQEGEDQFVKRRIYLTLERGRDIALRNLLRKVFIARGFEEAKEGEKPVRRSRVPVAEFAAAISLGSEEKVDNDEVECLLANMIYKVSPFPRISKSVYCLPSCLVRRQDVCLGRQGSNSQCKHPRLCILVTLVMTHLLIALFVQGLIKGYISRQHGIVVLSKTGAFPGTGV